MAEILLARERALAGSTRHLVIKRVLPEVKDNDEMLHMFLDEARVVMGLSHPNLCQIYEVGEQEGTWFIAMEWVNGATLHQLIRHALAEADVDYAVMARIIAHAAEALHHAHTARDAEGRLLHLVHRDVSPHNIMLGYDGRVKLLDFGIAKTTKSTHQTEAGVVKGKVCYMAPEQWLQSPVDARTDVFALGACLYEALTGRMVFRRETQSDVMRAVLREGAPPLSEVAPEVPPALAIIAHKALAFAPHDRFQTALEMSEALEQYLASRSMPLAASRVAAYVRRLFRAEVELGPVLERQVRGAELAAAPIVLPPLPPALLGLPKLPLSALGLASDEQPAELAAPGDVEPTPGLRRFGSLLPTAPDLVAAATLDQLGRALAPAEVLGVLGEDAPALTLPTQVASESFGDLGRSGQRVLSQRPVAAAGTPEEGTEAAPSRDSDPETGAKPRPLARTVSMHAASRVRRVALLVVPGALAMAAVMFSMLPSAPPSLASVPKRAPAPAAQLATPASEAPAPLPETSAVAEQPQPEPGQPAPPDVRGTREHKLGKLSINTRPWSTVYLGKRVLGTTPLASVTVPRTALTLKLVDRDGHVHLRRVPRARATDRTAFFDFTPAPKRAKRR
jgi:hypothetical protein